MTCRQPPTLPVIANVTKKTYLPHLHATRENATLPFPAMWKLKRKSKSTLHRPRNVFRVPMTGITTTPEDSLWQSSPVFPAPKRENTQTPYSQKVLFILHYRLPLLFFPANNLPDLFLLNRRKRGTGPKQSHRYSWKKFDECSNDVKKPPAQCKPLLLFGIAYRYSKIE